MKIVLAAKCKGEMLTLGVGQVLKWRRHDGDPTKTWVVISKSHYFPQIGDNQVMLLCLEDSTLWPCSKVQSSDQVTIFKNAVLTLGQED